MPKSVFITLLLLLANQALAAGTSRATLPKGIWHPSVRYGYTSELTNRFDNSGSLNSVSRLNQAFSGEKVKIYSQEAKGFCNSLTTLFPNSGYCEQMSFGNLEFEADAHVEYWAPSLAYGLSNRLSVGVGIPFVTVDAKVKAVQTGHNNVNEVCNQIAQDRGGLPAELQEGCARGENINVVAEYEKALQSRGFIVPREKRETVMGDLLIAGVYQYFETKRWILYEMTTITLPTGPEDNPDDFLDVPLFHQTGIKAEFHQDYRVTSKWTLGSLVGYHWKIADTALKRVPEYEGDVAPRAERKERVARDLGDVINIGPSTNYWISRVINLNTGYEYNYKFADKYQGSRGYDYSLLGKNTESEWHKINAGFTVSTIDLFLAHQFVAPFQVLYNYSDIVAGTNVDRAMTHELMFRMFF